MSVAAVIAYERGTRRAPYRDTVRFAEALGIGERQRGALFAAAKRAWPSPASAALADRDLASGDSRLPTGTVTFVFTDIEGSTKRWEHDRAAMSDVVRRHDRIVRTAIESQAGHVFKTIGDAFCAAFARPQNAVAAAIDAQRALAAEDFSAVDGLRVRFALHAGTADERDADYFGPTVNRVARLLSIAHGGQVLLSGTVGALVSSELPPDTALRDLGEHRLQDLAHAERVWQLVAPGLQEQFPPLRSLAALPTNLPVQTTSFVGRESESSEIAAALEAHRIVTLVGSGGVGKTRAALAVGANLLDRYADGVWFVELAPLQSGDYIPTAVAQAIGISLRGAGKALDVLARALKHKEALLILDNCEHLIAEAAGVTAAITRECPHVRILATSRQSLDVTGEARYRVPSLASPPAATSPPTLADAARFPAVALFVQRGASADNGFELTESNVATIGEICRRLDGIPFAIELAAARLRVVSPEQLRALLDDRFRVLGSGNRSVLPRHQTLRALIDWSYDLLAQRERVLFRALSVFVNGFTLEGAMALGRAEDGEDIEVLDALAALVDQSLVMADPAGDLTRYRMLESTRAYAREKMVGAGEATACATRHLRYVRDLVVAANARRELTGRAFHLDSVVATELEDVRSALEWAARSEPATGGELLAAMSNRWVSIGLELEGIAHLERFIALLPPEASPVTAELWTALARLSLAVGQFDKSLERASHAVRLARAVKDAKTTAYALYSFINAAAASNDADAAAAALAEAQAIVPAECLFLRALELPYAKASLLASRDDVEAAYRAWDDLRKSQRALGNYAQAAVHSSTVAEYEHQFGRTERAVAIAREELPALRAGRNRASLLIMLGRLAGFLIALDRTIEASAAAREALHVSLTHDPGGHWATFALEHLTLAIALEGDLQRAAELAGYSEAALKRIGRPREGSTVETRARLESLLRERLAAHELTELMARGDRLGAADAVALALADDR